MTRVVCEMVVRVMVVLLHDRGGGGGRVPLGDVHGQQGPRGSAQTRVRRLAKVNQPLVWRDVYLVLWSMEKKNPAIPTTEHSVSPVVVLLLLLLLSLVLLLRPLHAGGPRRGQQRHVLPGLPLRQGGQPVQPGGAGVVVMLVQVLVVARARGGGGVQRERGRHLVVEVGAARVLGTRRDWMLLLVMLVSMMLTLERGTVN